MEIILLTWQISKIFGFEIVSHTALVVAQNKKDGIQVLDKG